jgi:hypothetical protein
VAGFVAYFDADHAEAAAAERAGLAALDFDLDRGGFAWLDVAQLADAEVAMPAGDVEEEVADGSQARRCRGFGGLRADALEGAEADLEDAWPGPVDRRRQQLTVVELARAGEQPHYWAASSHHQLG